MRERTGNGNGLLLKVEEVGTELGLGRSKVYELIAAGELPSVHIGRALRVRREDLETYVRLLRSE